jgi:probable DNA metabolism protein
MPVFFYDKTFEGLLSAVFDAYSYRIFPAKLLRTGDVLPLFAGSAHAVVTEGKHAQRVWNALMSKSGGNVCSMIACVWLSELDGCDELLFRYICKLFGASRKVEYNFGDDDVLEIHRIARKVAHEALYIKQFVRFQKTADDIFFAPVKPVYNALPLAIAHFSDRFSDQQWIIYDLRRKYGYYYDLHAVEEITFADGDRLIGGKVDASLLAKDEKLFQVLWKGYFKAMTIRERINPRLQRKNMPARFWSQIIEKN